MPDKLPYDVEHWEVVSQVSDLRVAVFTLAAGQCVPWHIHTQVSDTFFCLEGPMVVEHRGDLKSVELAVGERHVVPPNTPHQVSGKDGGRCRFVIIQGIGTYDFVPIEGVKRR